ncbi:MAG TPA: helix-turn-helix domain-containing protein [Candidatus Limnocylindria bacterium]|jgi:excisionase family DNA binding protein|nr:helix-turn-helix domain-containing protein [Candidatus Limnocylindria bacterium]
MTGAATISSAPTILKLVLTPEEAAKVLSCSRQYVHELIARGELRSVKLGRLRRIPVDGVRELLARLEAEQTPSAGAPSRGRP